MTIQLKTSGHLKHVNVYSGASFSMMDTEDLHCCSLVNRAFLLFQYEAKPTEPTKKRRGMSTYSGFFIMNSSAEVRATFCPCKGSCNGTNKHVTDALFDLQSFYSIK